jgi:hypothetical protein
MRRKSRNFSKCSSWKKREEKEKEEIFGSVAGIKGRKEGGFRASSFWLLDQQHSEKKGIFFFLGFWAATQSKLELQRKKISLQLQ